MTRFSKLYCFLFLILLLSACTPTTPEQQFKGMTSEQIYANGEKALAKGHYGQAVKYFEGLQTLYPFGPASEQGQKDLIYAYYKNGDIASALAACDRFIHLYPQSNNVDYVYFMKGLINFKRNQSWIQKYAHVSPAENDITSLRQSFMDFNELLQRFPDSQYAPNAHQKMVYVRDVLAQNELDAAQFYYRHGAYVAAVKRSNFIVNHFQGTPQVIDALGIMVKANRALGLQRPADEALEILHMNYPNSDVFRQVSK